MLRMNMLALAFFYSFLVLLNENVGKRIKLPKRITRATRQLRRSQILHTFFSFVIQFLLLSVFKVAPYLLFTFVFFSHFRSSFEFRLDFVYCAFSKLKLIWAHFFSTIQNKLEWKRSRGVQKKMRNFHSEYHLEHKPLRIHCGSNVTVWHTHTHSITNWFMEYFCNQLAVFFQLFSSFIYNLSAFTID